MATKHELYRGNAIITNIEIEGAENWSEKERSRLNERDALNAFKLVYECAERDANGARHEVKVEISHRELSGKMLQFYTREDGTPPTQMDIALRQLIGQGILHKGAKETDITDAASDALIGRSVTICVSEDMKDDGTYWPPRATFASKYARLTGEDKLARISAFLGGKPAAKPAPKTAKPAVPMPAAPAEDDPDMLPF